MCSTTSTHRQIRFPYSSQLTGFYRPAPSSLPLDLREHRGTPGVLVLVSKSTMPTVHLLDYVAGNVRSLVNAIGKLGYTVEWIKSPADVLKAEV